ncbi:MAG: hypothetical protein WC867_07890 [Candidatus Pacearchaeota archaeon]|jgi:hypothetical protein
MKKDTMTWIILILIVLLIISSIYAYKNYNKETPEEKTILCIAKEGIMYSQSDCIHCKQQKEILGEYINLFNIIECDKQPLICDSKKITRTPTWEFYGKLYPNVKSIKELADIAGCDCKTNINVLKNETGGTCSAEETNCIQSADTICSK